MLERFEAMPAGWQIDKSWGSPECGWQPIHNGCSVLSGGLKGLLRVQPIARQDERPKEIVFATKERAPDLSAEEVEAIAETTNHLARAKFKEKLLQELLFDLQVCMIEGWDCKEYVTDLKQLIDETYRKVVPLNGRKTRTDQGLLF